MKIGDRVTLARCHPIHKASTKALVGQSGLTTGRRMGDWVVLLDCGETIAVADRYLEVVDPC